MTIPETRALLAKRPELTLVFSDVRQAYMAAALLFPETTRTTRVAIADATHQTNASLTRGEITLTAGA